MYRQISCLVLASLIFTASPLMAAEEDESIYVVQRRTYSKRGKFEITPTFLSSVSNKFVGFLGPALGVAYHVRENLAIGAMYAFYNYNYYSGLVYEVYKYEDLIPENVDLKQLRQFAMLNVQWSALYGKLRLIPGVLGDFDVYISAGLGFADTREPCMSNQQGCESLGDDLGFGIHKPDKAGDRFKLTGNFGIGFRVFFADWLGIKIEVQDISYGDKVDSQGETTSDIRNNFTVFVGASFLLGKRHDS